MSDGERSRLYNLDPVLLEYHPDGDFWTVHREEEASPEKSDLVSSFRSGLRSD